MKRTALIVIALANTGLALPAPAQNTAAGAGTLTKEKADQVQSKRPYSPYADRNFPTRPLFGDTHLHTGFSMDAGAFGCTLTPRDASASPAASRSRPPAGSRRSSPARSTSSSSPTTRTTWASSPTSSPASPRSSPQPMGRKWYDMIQAGKGADAALEIIGQFSQGTFPKELMYLPGTRPYKGAWQETIAAAETYNEPGRFTAFIGYEWTSLDKGNNLHRNVIFRDNGDKASQVEPFTCYPPMGSINPLDLWKWMEAYEKKTGGSVLAIAHNGNLSNGTMFPIVESFGKAVDGDYAAAAREVGARSTKPPRPRATAKRTPSSRRMTSSPTSRPGTRATSTPASRRPTSMLAGEYARSALKNGLKLEAKLGTNPYKFGMVGSSDAHTGLAAMEEENFFGKTTPQEPSPERMHATFMDNPKTGIKIMDWEVGASGYAAVWAQENTRESIWDAMQRKETYATTGSRMVVRFFGGWDFDDADAETRNPAFAGYTKGVPMGGDLSDAPAGKSPTFLVAALKDPIGANLDRIQIIKGWLDAKGETQEKVYDVVWGGDRKPDANGKLPSVGSTVDIENATWTNTIGAPELIAVWKDPDFDAKLRAFYYVRVLEIPTPRWTAYDAKRFGTKPLEGTRMTIQERAYTSPIWYTPAK